ncbi:MAG: penicillin acylase family protein [Pseudomonadales bacterium]
MLSLTNQAIVVLDGDRSECQWGVDDDAPEGSGLFGFNSLPSYSSTDYAVNSNDSYWLSNTENPLEGFPQVMGFIGGEGEQQALRTRINHEMVAARLAGTDGFDDSPGFTVDSLQRLMYENRVAAAEITVTDILAVCDEVRSADGGSPSESYLLAFAACGQLALWDKKANLDSQGTQVFTEFWRYLRSQLTGGFSNVVSSDDFWRIDFDPAQPLTTPRGVDTTNIVAQTLVIDGLSEAARRLNESNVELSRPWGEVSVFPRNGVDIPIHGGDGSMGVFGAISSGLSDGGYRNIRAGNSYIQTVTWDDSECPIAEGILTHSQSIDPASPHYSDQSELYSSKAWVSFPFCDTNIETEAIAETLTIQN